jgi:hypothetical protein
MLSQLRQNSFGEAAPMGGNDVMTHGAQHSYIAEMSSGWDKRYTRLLVRSSLRFAKGFISSLASWISSPLPIRRAF